MTRHECPETAGLGAGGARPLSGSGCPTTQRPDIATHPQTRATRADWLEAARATLIGSGVEQVRILPLAKRLQVSRSSFYWYFKDRQDLLDQLLTVWRDTNTRDIVEQAGRPAPTIVQGVLNVFACWVDGAPFDPRLDFAVREWARRSGDLHRLVEAEDEVRVDAIRAMFARHGYAEADAFIRARVLYFMQIGYYALELNEPQELRLRFTSEYLRSFTGQEPTADEVATFQSKVRAGTLRAR